MNQLRRLGPALLLLVLPACVATPPERDPLPPVEEVLDTPGRCTFLVGAPQGVLVEDVLPDGAAEGSLQPGDVIVAVDGEPTEDATALLLVLGERSPGEVVRVTYRREGRDQELALTLGANPDDPSRAMLGVLVDTRYQEVAADEVTGEVAPSRVTRPVVVGETVYLLDPVAVEWQRTNLSTGPDLAWVAAARGLYLLTEDGEVVELVSGSSIRYDRADGWDPLRLIGSVGPDLLLTVTRPAASATAVQVALSRFDPGSGSTVWTVPVPAALGLPVSALTSPDGDTIVVVGVSEDGTRVSGVDLLDPTGVLTGADLAGLGTPVGWMDAERILFRTAADQVTLYDTEAGETAELTLDPEVTAVPLYPVGDGRQVLAVAGRTLLRDDLTVTGGVRALAENCLIGLVGEPGWGL